VIFQDKWEGENVRYLKVTEKDFWKLGLTEQILKLDYEHLAPQDPGKLENPSI